MDNPFKPDDKIVTKFMGAEVEALVTQVYNTEVQVRTPDKVRRWRTMFTVWYPGQTPIPKPPRFEQNVPSQAVSTPNPVVVPPIAVPPTPSEPVQPVPEPPQPVVPVSAGESPMGPVQSKEQELAIVPSPTVGLTSCGLEEAGELQRVHSKNRGKRKSRR